MDKNILFLGISIFLLGFVTSDIQLAEARNIAQFTSAEIVEQFSGSNCGALNDMDVTTKLSLTNGQRFVMDPDCEYWLQVSGDSAAAGSSLIDLFEEEFGGVFGVAPQKIQGILQVASAAGEGVDEIFVVKCDDDLDVLVQNLVFVSQGFVDTGEREAEFYIENGSGLRAPPFTVWVLVCSNAAYSQVIMGGTVTDVFDDGFLSGAVVVGDPWAASFEFSPGQTLFNDGTTSSFRVSNVEFGFGTGNDMIKYSNLPPSALFDDSITAFDDFGGPPFDEIQTQDFTLQQDSGPLLPTADVFLGVDFFDADGTVIGSPINSFSDLLNVLENPNFLSNLEAQQILFEALDGLPVPGAPTISSPLVFSPNQFGQGVAILGTIDTIIVTRSQQAVGGEIIPIETTSLILAGAQTFSWMIPVILSGIGIGLFVVSRKSE